MANKILIVEDSRFFRQLLKEFLESKLPGVVIDQAVNEDEAIQKTDALRPDVIFMDLKLAGKGGFELTQEIKEKYPDTKIAILTAYDASEYREAAGQYGADRFLSKGSDGSETILEFVRSALKFNR